MASCGVFETIRFSRWYIVHTSCYIAHAGPCSYTVESMFRIYCLWVQYLLERLLGAVFMLEYSLMWYLQHPRYQSSWGQHGAHLGPVGPRWAPCWPHEPCYGGPCCLCAVSLSDNNYAQLMSFVDSIRRWINLVLPYLIIQHFTGHMSTYQCWDPSQSMLVKVAPGVNLVVSALLTRLSL